jgi:hypothetical protein
VEKQPLFDRMSVRVVDGRRAAIEQKMKDKTTWKGAYTVSKSGAEMTLEFENDLAAKPVTGTLLFAREGTATAGAHPLTGTWRPEKLIRLSPSGLTLTFTIGQSPTGESTDNGFTLLAGDGRRLQGKTDAKDYPLQGYFEGATLSVNQTQPDVWTMNRKQNATLVEILSARVLDGGASMTLRQADWLCKGITVFTLRKQTGP